MSYRPTKSKTIGPQRLTLTMVGPKADKARLSVASLAHILKLMQKALKGVARILIDQGVQHEGRKHADMDALCELFFVGWRPGSAIAEIELAAPPQQKSLFPNIGQESLAKLVEGLSQIQQTEATVSTLPPGFDREVLKTCYALMDVLERGIDSIMFQVENGERGPSCLLDRRFRYRIQNMLDQPAEVADTIKIGRLEELNGHGKLTGKLWEPNGDSWLCHFDERHSEQLSKAWMRRVRVVGKTMIQKHKTPVFEVDSLEILEHVLDRPSGQAITTFWRSQSLEELAAQQGVAPVSDLNEIAALWPGEEDPEKFLRELFHEREARRAFMEVGNSP